MDGIIFPGGAWSLQQWSSEIASPGVMILFLAHAGQSCGFLSCGIAGDDLEIRKIGVLPTYRRLGLGRQLLWYAMNHSPPGVRRCLIEVSSANSTGLLFYQKLGFAEIGRRSNYYSDGTAAILMEKILSAP